MKSGCVLLTPDAHMWLWHTRVRCWRVVHMQSCWHTMASMLRCGPSRYEKPGVFGRRRYSSHMYDSLLHNTMHRRYWKQHMMMEILKRKKMQLAQYDMCLTLLLDNTMMT